MSKEFFPLRPEITPLIYAYEEISNPELKGYLKIGYTENDVKKRVAQQFPTARPGKLPYKIVLEESAMKNDGSSFTDRDIHKLLRKRGFENPRTITSRKKTEWFKCSVKDVKSAILNLRNNTEYESLRDLDFKMRPEQQAAVDKTAAYFISFHNENKKLGKTKGKQRTPHFLWNAKMRFGKTFTAYQLALKMGWKKVLVLTFKPAVQSAWEDDIKRHIDFEGWQFVSRGGLSYEKCNKKKPFICFGSFQDFLGKNPLGGIKYKNEWVHTTNWDCVILDEYHYGAWRDNAKELFESEDDEKEKKIVEGEGQDYFDEDQMPITTNAYLYLSGTPFRALATGEFIEEQIFNWTYSDEQYAKENWNKAKGSKITNNPYAALPRIVMLTYQLPDTIRDIARKGEYDEFDLNVFFYAEGIGKKACFKYEDYVQKWLDLIRGAFQETTVDNLKLGAEKPPLPFTDARLLHNLTHTFWFLPSVAACDAMYNLIKKRNNTFYQDYQIIVAAGSKAGIGVDALSPVREAMGDPIKTKTITLSCGKLTTGVSVKPWTGIFMLRNLSSPETYFQAAFRVQTPWTIINPDEMSPNKEMILKEECYIFDFAPDRALRQISDYACQLNVEETNPEKKVGEFIKFLPILSYDGFSMKQIDATGILEIAMTGTAATLLAKRWESSLLVNVDNDTLARLMANERAMKILMSIEGFRNLNQDIETIINNSNLLKKAKQEANEKDFSVKDKKELSDAEKEYKNKRKAIQEKLIKFATRIPIFMYLTDYREMTLTDVITKLEPELFKKVTGLYVKDFELLVSLGVFNSAHMNSAVYNFKRYEDASLVYTGVDKHEDEDVGLYDTKLKKAEYQATFKNMKRF